MNTQPTTAPGPRQPAGPASTRIRGLRRIGEEEAAPTAVAIDGDDRSGLRVARRSRVALRGY